MDAVIKSGPLFDGRASAAAATYAITVEDSVAQEGVNRIQNRLQSVLQHPTGFYESNIHTERAVADTIITDMPVIYGPWLEGVGSRNQTTRFKGYHTFREISQELDADATVLAEEKMVPYLAEMNLL